ncbi:hypothetical protein BJV82DRAFT_668255 [Fennellomyces sp. T-0311]|nr:hypothetical protein BJV82DRAFT_668255 [Fennellomyces sp. T-0311]
MARMARLRNDQSHVLTELTLEHYNQRATDGGLLIAEGALVSPNGGPPMCLGMYSTEQIRGWKRVTGAVRAKGGVIYNQLWHVGRATTSFLLPDNNCHLRHLLLRSRITETVNDFVIAAKNAIAAGFDGVEIHDANSYLVVSAVVEAVGDEKIPIRFSPWSNFRDMKDDTPYETWGYIIDQVREQHPKLGYLHMVEPRMNLAGDNGNLTTQDTLDPFRAKWPGAFISAGGCTAPVKAAHDFANLTGNLVAFGRIFTSNPDLVERLRNDWSLTKYNRATFYGGGAKGYLDFANYTHA